MKKFALGILVFTYTGAFAQKHIDINKINTPTDKPINIVKLGEDSMCSTFAISIKNEVKLHKHVKHTENVYVIEGTGILTLGDSTFSVKPGDYFFIPKNTAHGMKVTSSSPVKILSVQSPSFDGTDREFIK